MPLSVVCSLRRGRSLPADLQHLGAAEIAPRNYARERACRERVARLIRTPVGLVLAESIGGAAIVLKGAKASKVAHVPTSGCVAHAGQVMALF